MLTIMIQWITHITTNMMMNITTMNIMPSQNRRGKGILISMNTNLKNTITIIFPICITGTYMDRGKILCFTFIRAGHQRQHQEIDDKEV